MSLGKWGEEIANGDDEIAELLTDVPGPMCPKIDKWVMRRKGSVWGRCVSTATRIGHRRDYSDDADGVDALYSEAESISNERAAAFEGLEECRTALDAMRDALVKACRKLSEARKEIETMNRDGGAE